MIRLVYLAPVDWHSIRQRPQRLAAQLSADFELTYVNPVGLRGARIGDFGRLIAASRERLSRARNAPGRQKAQIPVWSPKYIPILGSRAIEAVNRHWLRRQSRTLTPKSEVPWILWIGAPSLLARVLLDHSRPSLVVYDCMDYYAAFHQGATRRRVERDEGLIVDRADLVFGASRGLVERLTGQTRAVEWLPNGVDLEAFCAPSTIAAELANLPRPIVGYHGVLGPWLDVALLARLADARPNWSFVFVGPNQTSQTRPLLARPNVYQFGPVPSEELPTWSCGFDVGVVPFQESELTRNVHPLKVLEYLALGLPVVSVPWVDLGGLATSVRLAESTETWLTALEAATQATELSATKASQRRSAVASLDWSRIATRARDAMLRSLAEKTPVNGEIGKAA